MPEQISTLMLDFRLNKLPTDAELDTQVIKPIESLTRTALEKVETRSTSGRRTVILESKAGQENDILVVVRLYDRKDSKEKVLLAVTVELPSFVEDFIQNYSGMDLEDTLKTALENNFGEENTDVATFYPVIKRCVKETPYMRTSDDRLVEYGFTKVLFSQQSPHQHVQIVETNDFGRLLNLDRMTNLAESDTIAYTHTLMNLPVENYEDKEVLILGGGDGALMKELLELKKPPRFVTMVDIDEVVMDACAEFMPSVCGPYLKRENWDGKNYKIIAGCAIEFMKKQMASGKKYDYIFGDLTDTPVSDNARDASIWEFLKSIISMGVSLLKPNTGKYMTHCNGVNVPQAHKAYEDMLLSLAGGKCTFERYQNFVPSFSETWMYYRITRHE